MGIQSIQSIEIMHPNHWHARMGGMRALLLPILIVLAMAGVFLFARGGGSGAAPTPVYFDKTLTLTSATEKAKADGKVVFVFVTADWCGPCQSFKRGALADARVATELAEKTVPLYVDATASVPEDIAQFGISGFPSVILVRDGQPLGRFAGATSADNLLGFLRESLSK